MNIKKDKRIVLGWIPPLLWVLGSLAIFSAIFRVATTGYAVLSGVMPSDPSDMHYVEHPWLTALHAIPGTLFLLLRSLQFVPSIRLHWPRFHRISGRISFHRA